MLASHYRAVAKPRVSHDLARGTLELKALQPSSAPSSLSLGFTGTVLGGTVLEARL
jgi:hypothetical protein